VIIYMLHRPSNVSVLLTCVVLIYTGAFLVLWAWVIWGFSLEWRRRYGLSAAGVQGATCSSIAR
jgi:hypothetical protein